jgi:hypothetical protein
MAIVINGSGTVTGISVGGLPDDIVTADDLANSINTDIATGVTAGTTASAALPKAGGTMTGDITDFYATGAVLQTVAVLDTSAQTIATTTYTDTNLSVAITPKKTSSKILAFWSMQANMNADRSVGTRLVRAATTVYESPVLYDITSQSNNSRIRGAYAFLDSPSTTSATTYKVQIGSFGSYSNVINSNGQQTYLILQEIGA